MTPAELGQRCDFAVVVGGDGTMLGIARQLSRFGIPLVGINQGRLASSPTCRWANTPRRSRP
jgi:NAD+ kinase